MTPWGTQYRTVPPWAQMTALQRRGIESLRIPKTWVLTFDRAFTISTVSFSTLLNCLQLT